MISYFSILLKNRKTVVFSNIPPLSLSNYFGSKENAKKKKFSISDVEMFGLQNGISRKILKTFIVEVYSF